MYLTGANRENRTCRTTRTPRRQSESTVTEAHIHIVTTHSYTFVFPQGFSGKPGMEGPQGPVGMYVSDTFAK